MKRTRHSSEHFIRKLREADVELAKWTALPEDCKALGVDENTYYHWRNQCIGIKAPPADAVPIPDPVLS